MVQKLINFDGHIYDQTQERTSRAKGRSLINLLDSPKEIVYSSTKMNILKYFELSMDRILRCLYMLIYIIPSSAALTRRGINSKLKSFVLNILTTVDKFQRGTNLDQLSQDIIVGRLQTRTSRDSKVYNSLFIFRQTWESRHQRIIVGHSEKMRTNNIVREIRQPVKIL